MKVNSISTLRFKGDINSHADGDYNTQRSKLVMSHQDKLDDIAFITGNSLLIDGLYSINAKKVNFPLMALLVALPTVLHAPFLIKDYKKAKKLNSEFKSEDIKDKSKEDKFIYNYLTIRNNEEISDTTIKKTKKEFKNLALGTGMGLLAGLGYFICAKSNTKLNKSASGFVGFMVGALTTLVANYIDGKKFKNNVAIKADN